MKNRILIVLLFIVSGINLSIGQQKLVIMENKDTANPLFCDIETGLCVSSETSENAFQEVKLETAKKPVLILYFTDPICSSCWGVEGQLRKLKQEYGDNYEIEYIMGGLLPSWEVYGGSDVRKPTDVAGHWDEASHYYEMPIDGNVWLEDPLASSYPPSIAFKAAQMQDKDKALIFLRRIKEMVFLEKKNITKWEHLETAAKESGLDVAKFKADYNGPAVELFNKDLELKKQFGVRGFPTIFFTDADDNRFKVYGSKPYEEYESALLKIYPKAKKKTVSTNYDSLFAIYPTITTKEFALLSGVDMNAAEKTLNELHEQKKIGKKDSRNGPLWLRLKP